jgi:hypothetical protein
MFKILKSLSKSLTGGKTAEKKPEPPKPAAGSVLDKVAKGQPAAAAPAKVPATPRTPEELCEITPKMSKSEIHTRLKLLYKRYNRAASSLNAKTREEADAMLNAIVEVREKHFGTI